ncbi:MAG: hypothetical protein GF411_19205 [Candidatus Lokiarchaeota archaeon]|nr:hypothetical protein [Candidatus Lokiarchaeota archaeon]
MTQLSITTDREIYRPGEEIRGQVHVICDKLETCEALRLDYKGVIQSRVILGSGKHRRIYENVIPVIDNSETLLEAPEFQAGTNSFNFTLTIPRDAPGSYYGHNGWIQYSVSAVIEKKNWPDKTESTPIQIAWLASNPEMKSETIHWPYDKKEESPLELDIQDDVVTLGKDFTFKFRVQDQQKLREVRAYLVYKEQVAPDGIKEAYLDKLGSWRIPDSELTRNSWIDVRLNTSNDWPLPLMSELVWTQYVLRVEVDVPFRFDHVAEIPLKVFYPFETREQESETDTIFEWEKS